MADHSRILRDLLGGNDQRRIERVIQAFLKMKKFDIGGLKRAAALRRTPTSYWPRGE
jgi:hypothetical protein